MENTTFTQEPPVLLQTRRNACKMLSIGMTKLCELLAAGEFDTVQLGNRELITTESILKKVNPQ